MRENTSTHSSALMSTPFPFESSRVLAPLLSFRWSTAGRRGLRRSGMGRAIWVSGELCVRWEVLGYTRETRSMECDELVCEGFGGEYLEMRCVGMWWVYTPYTIQSTLYVVHCVWMSEISKMWGTQYKYISKYSIFGWIYWMLQTLIEM